MVHLLLSLAIVVSFKIMSDIKRQFETCICWKKNSEKSVIYGLVTIPLELLTPANF